jgi:hypothetical protein
MPRLPPDGIVPADVYAVLNPTDVWGDPVPKRMGPFPFLAVAIRAGVPTRTVPEEYWASATDLENHPQASIDCRCGESVVIGLLVMEPCSGCERWFFFSGTEVLALNTPSPQD